MVYRAQRAREYDNLINAFVLARQGKNREAITRLNDAIRTNPRLGEAYFNLGMVYLCTGKKDLAIKILRTLKSVDTNWAAKLSREVSK